MSHNLVTMRTKMSETFRAVQQSTGGPMWRRRSNVNLWKAIWFCNRPVCCLARPRERGGEVLWWARLCVCLSTTIFSKARSLPNFCACCLWPWLGLPPAGWRNPKETGQFWGFPPHWQCIVARSLQKGSTYRPGRGDKSAQRTRSVIYNCLVMVALCNIADHNIFIL